MSVVIFRTDIPSSESMKIPFSTSKERNPQNMKMAVELYRKAAAQGEDRAMQALEEPGEKE